MELSNIFRILTPVIYWLLIISWLFIFIFYSKRLYKKNSKGNFFRTLIIILAIDSLRTLFESSFFGVWYTSLSGLISIDFYNFLAKPEIVFFPKIINLIVSISIISIIIKRWLPEESQKVIDYEKTIQNQDLILSQVPVSIMITDLNGKIEYVNKNLCDLTGYSEAELIGRNSNIFNSGNKSITDFSTLWDDLEQDKKWTGIFYNKKKNGDLYWESGIITPIFDSFGNKVSYLGIKEDITQKREVDIALKESEERFRTITENAPVLINSFDENGKCLFWNNECIKTFGWTMKEINNYDSALSLFYPDEKEYNNVIKSITNDQNGVFREWNPVSKQGETLNVMWANFKLPNGQVFSIGHVITESIRVEKALKESEERFRNAITYAPYPVMIHSDGKVLQLSEEWINLTGYNIDDIPTIKDWTRKAYGEDAVPSNEFIEKLYTIEEKQYDGEWEVKTKYNGSRIWDFSSSPMGQSPNGKKMVISMASDITKRKQVDNSLKQMALFPKLNPAPVIRFSVDCKIIDSNPAAYNIIGKRASLGEDINLTLNCFSDVDFSKCISNDIEMIRDQNINEKIYQFVILGISKFNVGHIYGTDITALKFAEEELIQSEEKLHQSQKMDAVGQLAGGIAHDFNNSLSGIIGVTELMLMDSFDIKNKEKMLNMILRSVEKVGELTKKLLMFSGKGYQQFTTINIVDVVDSSIDILKHTIDKNITIIIEDKSKYSNVIGDGGMIQNVLMNLVINSSHVMFEGGEITFTLDNIKLDSEYCRISPFTIVPGDYIEIRVRDTGSGMSLETQSHIFEPFFTTKEQGVGTGLGLSTVYQTVIDHEGAITVYSEVGHGTVFTIYIPLTEQKINDEEQLDLCLGSGTILLIDDEDILRETSKAMLTTLGYSVLTAENGEVGLMVFKENNKQIDLIILDMIMPVMGGREAFTKLREIDPNIPIIICSGFTKDGDADDLKKNGADMFIHKPFRLAELSNIISKSLKPVNKDN